MVGINFKIFGTVGGLYLGDRFNSWRKRKAETDIIRSFREEKRKIRKEFDKRKRTTYLRKISNFRVVWKTTIGKPLPPYPTADKLEKKGEARKLEKKVIK